MNLKKSWPVTNIRYQFATCLMAGGYPSAQVVDGIAGFTDPFPFHATKYPVEVLTEISKWNRFCEAYGAYYYYSNEHYLIRDSRITPVVTSISSGLMVKIKERRNKRTRQTDAVMIHLTNYGTTTDLKWVEINNQPAETSVTVEFSMPDGLIPQQARLLTPDDSEELPITRLDDNAYKISVAHLSLFASIVLSTNRSPEFPTKPEAYATVFEDYNFDYDARGDTQIKSAKEKIVVLDEQIPLVIKNDFNNRLSSYEISEDAFSGKQSISVRSGKLYFHSNSENAIRIPVDKFEKFRIAVKGNNATSAWFGFTLINPSSSSPVWETKDIYYRIGGEQSGLPSIVLSTYSPTNEWTVYERNLLDDIKSHPSLTLFWQHAIVIGIYLGPVDNENVLFDSFEFVTNAYNNVSDVKPQLVLLSVDSLNRKLFVTGANSSLEKAMIKLYNSAGNLLLLSKSNEMDIAVLSKGIYIIEITTNQGVISKKIQVN